MAILKASASHRHLKARTVLSRFPHHLARHVITCFEPPKPRLGVAVG